MRELKDQIVMVTGAAGNLGYATARAFLDAGAKVVLLGRRLERLEALFADQANSEDALFAVADLMDNNAVEGVAYEAVKHFGRVDVLANVAGGFAMGPPVHETSLDTWNHMLNLNARSVFLMARAVVPHMLQQGSGKIINVGSRAALEGQAKMAPYSVSKSAVIRLTEAMSAELKERGINVNCILPGTIDTPQNREAMPKADYSKWVPPQALADVILFLASDAARAVTGASIPVYGRG